MAKKINIEGRLFMKNTIKIGIICPCKIEYDQCKVGLNLNKELEIKGRLISFGGNKSVEIIAINAGPGKIQCASATQLIIDKYNLSFVIDVGASGALTEELNIYDIVCVMHSYEYDVLDENFMNIPEDIKTSTLLTRDEFEIKDMLQNIPEEIGLKIGSIACGEKNVNNKNLRLRLNKKFGAIGVNWETSSVLKIAELNKVRSFSFRVITDNADEEMKENLHTNWKKGLEVLFKFLKIFIYNCLS